jgi:ATP-dependent DNA ligase
VTDALASLPVPPTVPPMLSKLAKSVPTGPGWIYEPKWDGFRCICFRSGDALFLQSRDQKPLDRYFIELTAPLKAALPERCVVDGEIVIATPRGLDFDALQQRLHPAASRVKKLSEATPASFVAFDLLAEGDDDLRAVGFAERRHRLAAALAGAHAPIHLTPATEDPAVAEDWFKRFEGAGLDGVMAKRADGHYEPGERTMFKIKHERTCDAVVAGFRWHKDGKGERVGSLMLGLYDASGDLHHVGVAANFKMTERAELVKTLAPYRENALAGHPWASWAEAMAEDGAARPQGGHSRWNAKKDLSWEPLRIELVAEVAYEHMQGSRFRHTARFRRWRPDKPPRECGYEQLEVVPPIELARIFSA